MRKLPLKDRDKIAKLRPPGYIEDCIKHGRIEGDFLIIEDDAYLHLLKKYRGLGDVVATAAKPVAKVIDSILGTDLEHCGGCKKRQEKLNKAIPFK